MPEGWKLLADVVREHGSEKTRDMLFQGKLEAFTYSEQQRQYVQFARTDWASRLALRWLKSGRFGIMDGQRYIESIEIAVCDRKDPEASTNDPLLSELSHYMSPFMQMMHEAIAHFGITEEPNPRLKKQEIEKFFLEKRLPNGSPVSPKMASYMATMIRPPSAMKGGNKRIS